MNDRADMIIRRFCYATWGTYGAVELPGGKELLTVEQPWNDNRPGKSCIPEGEYQCESAMYYAGDGVGGKRDYPAIEIFGSLLNGRTLIKMHIANVPSELRGCIAFGLAPGWYRGQWSVRNSTDAFAEVMKQFGGREFTLRIERRELQGLGTL